MFAYTYVEYCVSIWNPYLAKSIDKLEQIQQRAMKLVSEIAHLPYEARLQYLNLYSLYCRRQRDLIVYKLVNHLIQVSPDPFFTFVNSVTRGHNCRIFKQHCKINARLKFFTNRVINQWNSLHCVITSDNLNKFKKNLDRYWSEIGYMDRPKGH